MFRYFLVLLSALACCSHNRAVAQIKMQVADSVVRYGNIELMRYRVGLELNARAGAVRDVLATIPVPLVCPEQEVTLIEEDFSSTVGSHDYRTLPGQLARQLLVNIPHLANKAEAHALLTFEVRTRVILPPENTSELVIPKKVPRELKRYLGKSPYIETKHSKFKKIIRKIFTELKVPTADASESASDDKTDEKTDGQPGDKSVAEATAKPAPLTDWQRVKAIYDHVQDAILYKEQPDKSSLATLKDGHGDCQNISVLFVALCRTAKIPARLVWVHQHVYSEFCLADAEGKLHWFPCETSGGRSTDGTLGTRAFGEMPTPRVIMQKGDNFKVPEQRKSLRYAAEYMIALPAQAGGGKPRHKFIREQL